MEEQTEESLQTTEENSVGRTEAGNAEVETAEEKKPKKNLKFIVKEK